MPGGRRGLVAPQNTFLDTLIKRASSQQSADTGFLLCNAQIVDFPVVFCSEEFSKLLGFPRSEVMQNSIRCDFMLGALSEKTTIDRKMETLSKQSGGSYEILYYRKNGQGIWLQEEIVPIRNEQGIIVLFLVTFRDITPFKEPLEGQTVMSNLSKFARLAWTITRSRPNNNMATSNHLSAASTAATANTSPVNSNALRGSNNLNVLRKNRTPVFGSPSAYPTNYGLLGGSSFGRFTDNLPEYRHEPPKTPPHILLHYSTFKVTWDWVILGLTFYTVIMVPFNLAVYRTSYTSTGDITFLVVDSIVDIIFLIDIVFNFHTSFVGNDGAVIVDEAKIRSNYLRSGFLIDVMACLPYDMLNIFDMSSDDAPRADVPLTTFGAADNVSEILSNFEPAPTGNSYGNIFSILKVMRLFRLGRVARALHRFLESSFALLFLMLSFYMVVAHWFACVWYVIGMEDLKTGISFGWLSSLATTTKKPFVLALHQSTNSTVIAGGPPTFSTYLTALYFTMTCMTSIGFGNVAAETDNEKTFCCCMMIISSLLYAAIFGHVTTIIHNATEATAKYHEMLNSVREFMTLNQVPRTLCERVLDYVVSKWANTKGVDQERVLSVCPKDMRADICVHLNRRVFNGCPAFRLASDGCLRALAVNFDMIHSAPGDFIFRKGESIRELCFVVSGSLEVIQDGEILAFLGKGDVFGDSGWRDNTVTKSSVHVRALTYCDIHMINVQKLKEILEFYKAFAQTFARNLVLTVDLSKRTVFYRIADKHLEKLLAEEADPRNMFTPSQIALLKRAVEKFKSQLAVDNGSMCSDPSPKNSLTYHRINPISPTSSSATTYQQQPQAESSSHGKRVTTSAIVSHEMDGSKSSRLKTSRLAHHSGSGAASANAGVSERSSLRNASVAAANVKWKDQDHLREVNASLTRLDHKIMHLETLLAKLTDRLGQQASADAEADNEDSKEAKDLSQEDKSSAI